MATAISHKDNGDGTVTEWYDDGTSQTWRIDSGEAVDPASPAFYNSGNQAWDDWARSGFTGHTAESLSGAPMYGAAPQGNAIVDYVNSDIPIVSPGGAVLPPAAAPPANPPGQVDPTRPPQNNPPPGVVPPGPRQPTDMERLLADNAARNAANDAAKLAYDNAMLRFRNDELAETLAQNAWKRTYEEKKFAWEQEWKPREFALQESGVTGMYNGAPTEQRIARENNTAMGLLNLGAGLKGPSNYLTYLRTLSNTPAGLSSLLNGLKGSSAFSSMQTNNPNAAYERQSVNTLMRDFQQGTGQPGMDASGVDLPGGAQWNARNFGILKKDPTQLGLLQNLYEESGRDFGTEYAGFLSSLPRFGGAQAAQVQIR